MTEKPSYKMLAWLIEATSPNGKPQYLSIQEADGFKPIDAFIRGETFPMIVWTMDHNRALKTMTEADAKAALALLRTSKFYTEPEGCEVGPVEHMWV